MASKLKPVPPAPDVAVYPAAPRGMPARQRALWRDLCRSKPVTWWDATALHLLAALVGHVASLEKLQAQVSKLDDLSTAEALARFEVLARLRDRESKQAAMLATRLRLTAQSRYEPRRAYRDGVVQPVEASNPFLAHRRNRGAA